METTDRKALTYWAQLQEALNKRNPQRKNPNDDFNRLTKEERYARLNVQINQFINTLKKQ